MAKSEGHRPHRPIFEYNAETGGVRRNDVNIARLFIASGDNGIDPDELSDDDIQAMLDAPSDEPADHGADLGERPGPRLLRTFADAEVAARDYLCWLGYADAACTANGKDSGIDVFGADIIAQVKMEGRPSSRVQLQLLTGAAAVNPGCQTAFFSLAGYTPDALTWADRVLMALFTFDLQGQPVPINEYAQDLLSRVPQRQGPLVEPMAGGVWDTSGGIFGSLEELPGSYFGNGEPHVVPAFMPGDHWRPLDWPFDDTGAPLTVDQARLNFPPSTKSWVWLTQIQDDALKPALEFRARLSPRPRLQFGAGISGVGWAWLAFEVVETPTGLPLFAVETAPLPAGRGLFDMSVYGMEPPVTAYCTSVAALLQYTKPWRQIAGRDDRMVLIVSAQEADALTFDDQ